MTTFAICATGPSMSQAVAYSVRHLPTVVVNNAWQLRPDAAALVAQDKAWWNQYPEAKDFAGRKFSTNVINGVERILPSGLLLTGSGSGMLAIQVAVMLGATKMLLLGYDMRGSHYFGPYPKPLKETSLSRYEVFKAQLQIMEAEMARQNVDVVNCTQGSALDCFRMSTVEQESC